jgi:acetyl-CoA carboxylase biotin carboxyl carrier protein
MDLKEIKRLIQLVEEASISHFSIEVDNIKVEIKKEISSTNVQSYVLQQPQYAAPHAPTPTAPAVSVEAPVVVDAKLIPIKSQMVGTFYAAASVGSAPYVKVGDRIEAGQPVCIVEAMKLFNEIESEISGVVEKVCVANATPVEYGQELFLIRVD